MPNREPSPSLKECLPTNKTGKSPVSRAVSPCPPMAMLYCSCFSSGMTEPSDNLLILWLSCSPVGFLCLTSREAVEAHGDRSSLGGGAALGAAQHGLRGVAPGLDPGQPHRPLQLHQGVPQLAGCNGQGTAFGITGYSSRPPRRTSLPALPICTPPSEKTGV